MDSLYRVIDDAIAGLMAPEQAAVYRRARAEEDDREAKLQDDFRKACADCLGDLAQALHSPRIARADMESAQRHLMRALSIAATLDPE